MEKIQYLNETNTSLPTFGSEGDKIIDTYIKCTLENVILTVLSPYGKAPRAVISLSPAVTI